MEAFIPSYEDTGHLLHGVIIYKVMIKLTPRGQLLLDSMRTQITGITAGSWFVNRRYNEFFGLREQMSKRFLSETLPLLPKKEFFKGKHQVAPERQKELEKFLNEILRKRTEIYTCEPLALFLQMPEELRVAIMDQDMQVFASVVPLMERRRSMDINEDGPTWLLTQFRDDPNNKVSAIRKFEDWILKTKPQLTAESIKTLFLGNPPEVGLLDEVGNFDHSEVSSIAALGLLCKLLSFEHMNSGEAGQFRRVLQNLDQSILQHTTLQHHIHRNRGHSNRLDAFKVLQALEWESEKLQTLLNDDFAVREYHRWQESVTSSLFSRTLHQSSQFVPHSRAIEHVGTLARPAFSTREYRRIAERAYSVVRSNLSMLMPNRDGTLEPSFEFEHCDTPVTSGSQTRHGSRGHSVGGEWADGQSADGQTFGAIDNSQVSRPAWRTVPCPEPSWTTDFNMRADYSLSSRGQFDQQSDVFIVRASMRLPYPASLVACLFSDHQQFIKEALALRSDIPENIARKLKQLSEGQLVYQLQSATTVEPMNLHGTSHGADSHTRAHSELIECVISTPTAPHVTEGLWLLKTVRVVAPPAPVGPGTGASSPGSNSAPSLPLPPQEIEGTSPGAVTLPYYDFVYAPIPLAGQPDSDTTGAGAPVSETAAGVPRRPLSVSGVAGTSAPLTMSLQPSGMRIRPLDEGRCEVSMVALFGKESIRLVSGDLLGEKLLFWRTLENVLLVLRHTCSSPMPLNFKHSLLAQEPGSPMSPSSQSSAGFCEECDTLEVEMVENEPAFG